MVKRIGLLIVLGLVALLFTAIGTWLLVMGVVIALEED